MTNEGKKISFGFAKSIKKSALKVVPHQEEKKVDYIECLDEKSIKVVGEEETHDGPLVIPLLGSKTWYDRILNKTDADIFETKTDGKKNGIKETAASGNIPSGINGSVSLDTTRIKKEKPDETENVTKSLEEQAASEILNDLHTGNVKVEDPDLEVPITENGKLRGEAEPTLEDYEQIPIDSFGLAMLRGMGWKPDKGIGKNAKLVTAALPELRPRGMGLGADKVTLQKKSAPKTKEEEQLKLEKGAFVKIIAGKYANRYGRIECFDDEAGRVTVKMTLTGESESLTECLVQPVTSDEYTKYSKVLNAATYEEYKNKRGSNKDRDEAKSSDLNVQTSDEEGTKKRRGDSEKKSKKYSNYTSDESTDSDRKPRKRGNRENDAEKDHRHKRTKKSKKSHRRDSSSENSRKKSKKRDKDRHKVRERDDANSESTDHKKHKKHKRSRSRSPGRR